MLIVKVNKSLILTLTASAYFIVYFQPASKLVLTIFFITLFQQFNFFAVGIQRDI